MDTEALWQRVDVAINDGELGEVAFDVDEARALRAEHERHVAIETAARAVLDETLDETDTRERLQDVLDGERPVRIALVGCSKEKLDHAAPARELYTSSLFKMAREYAEATCARWFVLSAKYGLVAPETVIDPYEHRLDAKISDIRWRALVAEQLGAAVPREATLVLLAGDAYGAWRELVPNVVEEPLSGMGIGGRRGWLSRETKKAQAA